MFKTEITGSTEASVRAIGGITQVIRTLARIGAEIAAMVEQQGAATAEIAQTSQDTRGVSGHIAGVGAGPARRARARPRCWRRQATCPGRRATCAGPWRAS
jgi:hypothetical protein